MLNRDRKSEGISMRRRRCYVPDWPRVERPVFIKVGGVSFGLQIGRQTTNLGLLCALPSRHSG